MKKLGRILLRIAAGAGILLAASAIAGFLVIRSGWFREEVRERIIAGIERSTGARAEIGGFDFDWERLTATVSLLVVHGREPAGETPLLTAQSVTAGFRVISILERKVDLSSLRVIRPVVRIVFFPDGSNNIPPPRDRGAWTEDLLNLAVRRYQIDDGIVEYDNQKIPLNVRGEDLRAAMTYERAGPRYRGEFRSRRARVMAAGLPPLEIDATAAFVLEKSQIEFSRIHFATGDSRADLSGILTDVRAPRGTFAVKATIRVKDAVQMLGAPLTPAGTAAFDGQLSIALARPFEFAMDGRMSARGLGYTSGRLNITGAQMRANVRMGVDALGLGDIAANALGATIHGSAEFDHWRDFHFDGNIGGLNLQEAARIATGLTIPWNGTLAGDFAVDAVAGERMGKAQARLAITPAAKGRGIEGQVDAVFDQSTGKLRLENSHLATDATQVDVSGTLGETLEVRAISRNLNDLFPALELANANAPKELPVKLVNGRASFRGHVSGRMDDLHASGELELDSASFRGHAFDRFTGEILATRQTVQVSRGMLSRGVTVIEGSCNFDVNSIGAQFTARNVQLGEIAKEAGFSQEIAGRAAATVRVSGSLEKPDLDASVQVDQPRAFGEKMDALRANVRYSPAQIEVTGGEASEGPAKVNFQGVYRHASNDWNDGDVQFELAGQQISLSQIQAMQKLQPSLAAKIDGQASGTGRVVKREFLLTSVSGEAAARGVSWDKQALGDVSLTAETHGEDMAIRAKAQVRDLKIDGQGTWRLGGEFPGSATVQVSRASVASVARAVLAGGTLEQSPPPFEGFIDGVSATIAVALAKPRDFRAELTVGTLEVNPKPTQTLRLGVQAQDLILKNSKPIAIAITSKEARIGSAEFTGRDTSLEAAGTVSFDAKIASDLNVRGSMNLIILQLLNKDLVARGSATVAAAIRGSLQDPQLNGRMELKNASLYLGDLPNGVDNANGAVIFDRNRATIERLRAQTGGGTVDFSGFLGFGTPLVYRLQAVAERVRVRYPEDVSVTFNSRLALNGTSESSTVSGAVTLTRASFTPQADLAQILAQAARPVPTSATTNEYVRGMQFDVRVESDPSFQLQTSLARNLQAEVDLRLRGTPLRPVLLGTASVNEGEMEIFGNRYTVDRCDIRFVNPVRVDPILDVDLETKARGVTVNIAVSGTFERLNVNYSSDPPLQAREILALLAVGRAPGESGLDLAAPTYASSASLAEAGGGLISEAITEQLSSRFQRFFGASRVKIDPTTASADYLPQARLIIEQQVSKDITLTYITNLNRTQEQIVQVEWDFSRRWSAVAVREASGLFGIDFQYKKRFK